MADDEKVIELKQEPTTIWIKKGTKKMLDSIGERRDTYDDIITRLINENENLKQELGVSKPKTRSSTITLKKEDDIGERKIDFIYHVPARPLDKEFRLKITYTKVMYNNKEIKIYKEYADRKVRAKDYLSIVEKIIHKHISELFKINQKHILDLDWWKRMFKNIGLSEKSYESDIVHELIKMGIVP